MADSQRIKAALGQMDAGNDNHWTADGLPRLDTVKLLAADQSITREQVTMAFPGFSRATAASKAGEAPAPAAQAPASVATAQGGQGSSDPAAIAAPAAPQVPAPMPMGNSSDEDPDGADHNSEKGAAPVAPVVLFEAPLPLVEMPVVLSEPLPEGATVEELELRIEAGKRRMQDISIARNEVNRAYQQASDEVDDLTRQLEKLRPAETAQDAIQGYLAAQRKRLEQKAEQVNALRGNPEAMKVLQELVKGTGKSPLDAAMGRKTTRGTQRPGS